MKKTKSFQKIIILLSLFLLSCQIVSADEYQVPLPTGKQVITNDTEGHNDYQPWDDYSLDFQAGEVPTTEDTKVTQARCFSYGEPILASKAGKITKVVPFSPRHLSSAGYGAHVRIQHEDGSTGIYAHMINDTNRTYVSEGDIVSAGQIIGLMGDTGSVSTGYKNNPCPHDNNYGTHLHFELRNFEEDPDLGTKSEVITSKTQMHDPEKRYLENHFKKYPYIPQITQVYSIHPLQAQPNQKQTFHLQGKYFSEDSFFELPFCNSQKSIFQDSGNIDIECEVDSETKDYQVQLPNLHQTDGNLSATIRIGKGSPTQATISQVEYIPPKPGEDLNITIIGNGLDGSIKTIIQAKNDDSKNGRCDFKNQFQFLSSQKLVSKCKIPLNIGPVEQQSSQIFTFSLQQDDEVLFTDEFRINYGISSAQIEPLKTNYYSPTQFTITGKNVHRTTVFYVEGCASDQLRIIKRQYDKLVFECPLFPINEEPEQTSSHRFLLKTKSRYNEDGKNMLSDEEDQQNIILSGFISVKEDAETRVESIEPSQAIIGQETLFTVTGNMLPYSNSNVPLVWMEDCMGLNDSPIVTVLPETYSVHRFQFRCTPHFSSEELEQHQFLEQEYQALKKDDQKNYWKKFDTFFENLPAKKLHIKNISHSGTQLLSEQEVEFISPLYHSIESQQKFQREFLREDGLYKISGPPEITSIEVESITKNNRYQNITVEGKNLPYSLQVISDDCEQMAITYGSSENFDMICLLKKVAVQEIQVIDSSKQVELDKKIITITEVYEVTIAKDLSISITGVNLPDNLLLESPSCDSFTKLQEPTSSRQYLKCNINGKFSKPEKIELKISTKNNTLLFNNSVVIAADEYTTSITNLPQKEQLVSTRTFIKTEEDSKRFTTSPLFPDIKSPLLKEAVIYLSKRGLIEGSSQNTFEPEQLINLAEAHQLLRLPKPTKQEEKNLTKTEFISLSMSSQDFYLEPTEKDSLFFKDVNKNTEGKDFIHFAYLNNFLDQKEYFFPNKKMTRGQAAMVIFRLERFKEELQQFYAFALK